MIIRVHIYHQPVRVQKGKSDDPLAIDNMGHLDI
jgi:hypothetical protein